MREECKKRRNQTFDIAKGITIFLVIWGHVIQQGVTGNTSEHFMFKFIYAFHMPLFAVISGYFFHASALSRDVKSLLIPKVKKFLLLICIWNTVHYGLSLLLEGGVPAFGQFIAGWVTEIVNGYWFLWAILSYSVAIGIVIKKWNEKYWLLGFVFSLAICMLTPCRWVIVTLVPFFWVGVLSHKRGGFAKFTLRKSLIWFGLFATGMVIYFSDRAIGNSQIKVLFDTTILFLTKRESIAVLGYELWRLFLYYFLGLMGSITIIYLSKWLSERVLQVKAIRLLSILGTETMGIYLMQRILVEQLCPCLYRKLADAIGFECIYLPANVLGSLLSLVLAIFFTAVVYLGVIGLKKCKLEKII